MEDRLVFVIIINWNGLDDTISCINSLGNLDYKNVKIVVVDNASTEPIDYLEEQFPNIFLIKSKENLGFAGGNNIGIDFALKQGAESIWLLNNDTVVKSDSLNFMMKKLYSQENIGMVCPKIYYYDQPDVIWYGGGRIIWSKGITKHYGQLLKESPLDQKTSNEVDFATGCSLLIKSEVFNKTGLLKEDYFLYFEDTDFCCEVRMKGYKIIYYNKAEIWHKVSASTSRNAAKDYYFTRNNLYFMYRHAPKIFCFIFIPYFTRRNIRYFVWLFITDKTSIKKQRANAFFKGLTHFLMRKKGPMEIN